MSSLLRQLLNRMRAEGVSEVLRQTYHGYLRVNHFLVFYLDLRKAHTPPECPAGIEVRRITLDELRNVRAGKSDLPAEFFCDESHGFTQPFVAFVDGKLAAIHWLVAPGEFSRFLTLGIGDCELNYNTVLPEFRGKRLAQLLMTQLVATAKSDGHCRMFGVVHVMNVPQFKPMLDMGFRPVETLEHVRWHRPRATLRFLKQ